VNSSADPALDVGVILSGGPGSLGVTTVALLLLLGGILVAGATRIAARRRQQTRGVR
jgi:hypothetical protein